MAWTYNSSNVGSSGLATVRMLIQDTDSGDQLFSDSEIGYYVDSAANYTLAAVAAARTLAMKFGRKADKAVGDLKITYSHMVANYLKMASDLRSAALRAAPVNVYAGGISVSDKDTVKADTDRTEPSFYRNQFDYPGSTVSSSC